MKNTSVFKVLGIIILAVVIGIGFAACDTNGNDDNRNGQPNGSQTGNDGTDSGNEIVSSTFNVATRTEWENALSAIKDGGNNKTYTINIIGDFTVEGPSRFYGTGLTVNLRGEGHTVIFDKEGGIYIESDGTVILHGGTFKGNVDPYEGVVKIRGGTL